MASKHNCSVESGRMQQRERLPEITSTLTGRLNFGTPLFQMMLPVQP